MALRRGGLEVTSARRQFKISALKRKNELFCRIDMWGFVSVMLTLLFLLMPGTVVDPKGPAADLAGARSIRMPRCSERRRPAGYGNARRPGLLTRFSSYVWGFGG